MIYYIGYIHDITSERRNSDDLKKAIEFDVISKLPSKYYVKDVIDDYLKCCEMEEIRGVLLLINVDNFKIINDSFGHQEGDRLLEKVASRLKNIIAEEDLICRYSGDEFIIFRPIISNMAEAEEFVINIKSVFESEFILEDNGIFITASIGAAMFPDNGNSFDKLLKNADTAMYRAKSNGKDEWEFFDNSISMELSRVYELQKGLRTDRKSTRLNSSH